MDTETSSENNTSPDYDQIVNLLTKSCRGNNNGLPGDLVAKILCKLPVKSLVRFRTVCKPWKLVISSPVFVQIHLRSRSPKIVGFPFHISAPDSLRLDPYPFKIRYIVSAHNGLVCFNTYNVKNPLVLCNPSTREFFVLPKQCSGYCHGFGYISGTQEYKIISFRKLKKSCHVDMTIFTLGRTRSLRVVKDIILPGGITDTCHATSGTNMFWMGYDCEQHHHIVICYDVIGGRFTKINLPSQYHPFKNLFEFARNVDDSLIIIIHPPEKENGTFHETWILVEDGAKNKSWILYRDIEPPEKVRIIKPYHISRFDVSVNTWIHYVNDQDKYYIGSMRMGYVNYVESLVSINSFGIKSKYY